MTVHGNKRTIANDARVDPIEKKVILDAQSLGTLRTSIELENKEKKTGTTRKQADTTGTFNPKCSSWEGDLRDE